MTKETQCLLDNAEVFWEANATIHHFMGKGNVKIAYAVIPHPSPRATITLVNGRIETFLKYKEVVFELHQAGYSVITLDHRGQGFSGRMCDNQHKGYVASFNEYVDDLHHLISQECNSSISSPHYLVCHSMGSAIGALYQLKHPETYQKIAFCSPMFGISTAMNKGFAYWLVSQLHGLNRRIGKQPWYFFGQGNYLPVPFQLNQLTHSKTRYQWFKQFYQATPSLQLGGVTVPWLAAAIEAMTTIHNEAKAITVPTLVLQAEKDLIVDNQEQDIICRMMPNNQKWVASGARHEILMEKKSIRDPAMATLLAFLQK